MQSNIAQLISMVRRRKERAAGWGPWISEGCNSRLQVELSGSISERAHEASQSFVGDIELESLPGSTGARAHMPPLTEKPSLAHGRRNSDPFSEPPLCDSFTTRVRVMERFTKEDCSLGIFSPEDTHDRSSEESAQPEMGSQCNGSGTRPGGQAFNCEGCALDPSIARARICARFCCLVARDHVECLCDPLFCYCRVRGHQDQKLGSCRSCRDNWAAVSTALRHWRPELST